ncbi:MAG: preprotein translocase subunit SecY [Eubacteriales bacterium]|nr:preprotein translocase subunit SecY [Clostridiales bacterium]MDY5836229.1 preprotein translocase subunit SecY [Eubacteriales bacterium]
MGGGIFTTFKNAWRVEDIRRKIFFTLFAVLIFRLGTHVPVPGISSVAFNELLGRLGQLGSFLNIFSGGALNQVSILSLGIQPYINASIIMQLLVVIIPALQNLQDEGESGRKKIQQYTRYFAIGLALLMSFFYWNATKVAAINALPAWLNAFVVILSFTAGSAFIMWLAEQINKRGIGNGTSIIISIGIISRIPYTVQLLWRSVSAWRLGGGSIFVAVLTVLGVVAFFVFVIGLVVYISTSERRIPVQYAKKVIGRKVYGGQSSYLPIKVNQSGVLPVIFAVSVLMMPSTIAGMTGGTGKIAQFFLNFNQHVSYYIIYALMILGFTFFYSSISFNPVDISKNLQKNGGFIPGIRPGKPTADYIKASANKLSWFEALFLTVIVLLPTILSFATGTSQALWFGGTGVMIIVGVALDMVNQLEAQLMMRHYKGFLD